MRFVHIADCHLGGWREQKLRDLNIEAFQRAIQFCIDKKIEFILLSGDLFNTSLPSIECLKVVVSWLKRVNDIGIRVYAVAGSHDFSPSGKTILDVLENAGLLKNAARGVVDGDKLRLRFAVDEPTKVKITGLPGRRGMLDKSYYKSLDTEQLEKEPGFKIFMFHTAISEYKPKGMEAMEAMEMSYLPRGFNYYAGGHIHQPLITKIKQNGWLVMPGPLFPNNFDELEALGCGGMVMCEFEPKSGTVKPEMVK
ncbi:exonuclease SbcCD subunit D, partial [Candidatus Woesearchaeota archaeon]